MDFTGPIREWVAGLFIRAIGALSSETDRAEVLRWLGDCRDILASDLPGAEKFSRLYASTSARRTAGLVLSCVGEGVRNYRRSDLPLPVKVALPVTLLALPFIGGQAAGVAAVGGAVGVPAALLVFLGAAGITSILEAFAGSRDDRADLGALLTRIAAEEAVRRLGQGLRRAMEAEPESARRAKLPDEDDGLRAALLEMDPRLFERHVMSLFRGDSIELAWVTRATNDMGVDGFAKLRGGGVLVVQCKRYASDHPVGRPVVQQFKGVIEEQGATHGYFVTTSRFTADAVDSAAKSDRIGLVDMDRLVDWHKTVPDFGPA